MYKGVLIGELDFFLPWLHIISQCTFTHTNKQTNYEF